MKTDIVLSGVGGQGVLAAAFTIAASAMEGGLKVKQSEVHGMSQRGGAVVANLRISDKDIFSDTIPEGTADLILSLEPLEVFRYLPFLSPSGAVVTSIKPFVNIPNYPDIEGLFEKLKQLPLVHLIDAQALAQQAGFAKSTNMVMVGAASKYLSFGDTVFEKQIGNIFEHKDEDVKKANIKAFYLGKKASQ